MQLTYRVRFDDVQLEDWGNWPLPDREINHRLQQLRQDTRLFLTRQGDPAAIIEVEGTRRADQKEWKMSVTTSLSMEDAEKAVEFGLSGVQMLLVPSE